MFDQNNLENGVRTIRIQSGRVQCLTNQNQVYYSPTIYCSGFESIN